MLLVCDHASRAMPASLGRLGLAEASTYRHIAWDVGAASLCRALSERLRVHAVLAGYSRLVIDCNRRIEDPTSIVTVSDGEPIPGNQSLTPAQRQQRVSACYEPYHATVDRELAALKAGGPPPALVAIHSFTPVFGGLRRRWQVGVLWNEDARLAAPILAGLRREPALTVGDNEPYSGRHPADHTVGRHAESIGLPHVCLEVRQDELAEAAGVARWADRLAGLLGAQIPER
jgi:predicted N-formylglutamate amidohydrolase